jgi:uncharacterized protein (TIGR01319 family)
MNMPRAALLIDFGSTYTKLRAVDLGGPRLLGSGQGPSTVTSDITIGLTAALADLERHLGDVPDFQYRLASSSAAGGLRMITVGLVRELTAEAARQAALGAGAKLIASFAYQLTSSDINRITELAPDIVLLAGGTDGGNSEVICTNAALLARATIDCPIIVAGNRVATDQVCTLLADANKPISATENVMPEFGVLNLEPAREAIRQVFINRIVHAKGIDRAQDMVDRVLMPTPAAVLEGARLLADGHDAMNGLGSLLVVDVGGATTDVHSVCAGNPTHEGVVLQGLPEPYLKRTVEGDLGMRHNALAILEAAGVDVLAADSALPVARLEQLVRRLHTDVERLPTDAEERALDRALARAAVRIAVRRHAGTTETVYTVTGPVTVQRGKDLSDIAAVVGTGGPLAHGADPAATLAMALADAAEPLSLRPRQARLLLDRDYVLYACGLLASVEPQAALALGLRYIQPLQETPRRGQGSVS